MPDGNKNSVFNFGPGWFTIIYCLLMFWFYVGMCNAGSLNPEKLIEAAKNLNLDTVIGKVKYNERSYSVQPLAEGQWVTDPTGDWERVIISAGSVEGLETTGELKPLH